VTIIIREKSEERPPSPAIEEWTSARRGKGFSKKQENPVIKGKIFGCRRKQSFAILFKTFYAV
jgi:hypothetical protein